jgi:hypothetical protein
VAFASHYTQLLSMQLSTIAARSKRATGEKFLIKPKRADRSARWPDGRRQSCRRSGQMFATKAFILMSMHRS